MSKENRKDSIFAIYFTTLAFPYQDKIIAILILSQKDWEEPSQTEAAVMLLDKYIQDAKQIKTS